MATVTSLGIGSEGLLSSDLVDQLVAASRNASDRRITREEDRINAEITAFGSIKSAIDNIKNASASLADASSISGNKVTSTDEAVITATATSVANEGSYSFNVTNIAVSHNLASQRFSSVNDVVGTGTLTLSLGTIAYDGSNEFSGFTPNPSEQAVTVTLNATNNTLSGLRDEINKKSIGITASIINDGTGFVLLLSSDETGVENSILVQANDASLSGFNYNAGDHDANSNFRETQQAADAAFNVNGLDITSSTNQVTQVISGVTLNLLAASAGETVNITVSRDAETISENITNFIDAYNEFRLLYLDVTQFNPAANIGGVLLGDATLRGVNTQVESVLRGLVSGLDATGIRSLSDIGINTDSDNNNVLSFDSIKFQQRIDQSAQDVVNLLATSGSVSDNQLEFVSSSSFTRSGSYAVEISQVATQGTLTGESAAGLDFAVPVEVDDDNDEFLVRLNGNISNTISLTQGSYTTGDELAAEIQLQINNDVNLVARGDTVIVSHDAANNRFVYTSTKFGSNSFVAIAAIDSSPTNTSAATLGFSVTESPFTTGVNVKGTINGIEGVGIGQFLRAPSGSTPATSGSFTGDNVTGVTFPLVVTQSEIDNGDFDISVQLDGLNSAVLKLAAGTYNDETELASALQAAINADTTYVAAGIIVNVVFDSDANGQDGLGNDLNGYVITSDSTGNTSRLNVNSVGAGVSANFGLFVGGGIAGAKELELNDPAAGLVIKINGGATGDRGTVDFARGIADQLNKLLSDLIGTTGVITRKQDALDDELDAIGEDKVDLEARSEALTSRLSAQFRANDALISQLNSQASFLTQQFEILAAIYTNK